MKPIILGSTSPRRKEVFSYFSLPFEQQSPHFDEDAVPFDGNPKDYVALLAQEKNRSLHLRFPDSVIVTADTTVFREGKNYGKPSDQAEAFEMLSELAGRWHSVYTGVTVRRQEQEFTEVEETKILFNPLTPEEIRHYHNKIRWTDKAGGYAIQMAGGLLVRRIEGCYYNVMGLPVNTLRLLLKQFDIDLWDYLADA